MISADKIKWIIENIKPEGFDKDGAYITTPNGDVMHLTKNKPNIDTSEIYYPLFLQRVIEAINRDYYYDDCKYFIETSMNELNVYYHHKGVVLALEFNKQEDQTKEKAILYIVDKIRGEG